MTDHLQRRSPGIVPLVQCSVLYFGSAVPLETVAGLDSFKMPLRQRYTLTDDGHLLGIDATLTVYSAGMLVRYTADESSSVWFPIQALHVCAALKAFRRPAVGGGGVEGGGGGDGRGGLDFAAVDSSLTKASRHPPIFAFTNRRTKGIKVLECHMFVCNSVAEATTLVQSCMYAYEHKEGWLDVDSFKHASESMPRIIPADHAAFNYAESGIHAGGGFHDEDLLKEDYARVPLRGFLHGNKQELIHKYNVFGYEDNEKQRVGQTNFQMHRTHPQEKPAVAIQRQPPYYAGTDDNTRTSSAFTNAPLVAATGRPQVQYLVPKGYFATGVNPYGSVPFMFVPAPSIYPDESRNLKQKKKQKQNKVKKSEKTTNHSKAASSTKADEENDDEMIEEYYYVKKSDVYAPTAAYHQSTTGIQETKARWDDGPRRVTMPTHPPAPHQIGNIQNTSGYPAGTIDHQYITSSVPNTPRTIEGNVMRQQHREFSHDHNAIIDGRLDSQNALEHHARNMERANDISNRIELEEPIPDYPNDPVELYSDVRRYNTAGFHRTTNKMKDDETKYGDHSRKTDRLQPLRDNVSVPAERNGHCACDKMPGTEPEGKRGYAELLGDLGYMP